MDGWMYLILKGGCTWICRFRSLVYDSPDIDFCGRLKRCKPRRGVEEIRSEGAPYQLPSRGITGVVPGYYHASRFTLHASRFTLHASRLRPWPYTVYGLHQDISFTSQVQHHHHFHSTTKRPIQSPTTDTYHPLGYPQSAS
jgi:hypothetical protein